MAAGELKHNSSRDSTTLCSRVTGASLRACFSGDRDVEGPGQRQKPPGEEGHFDGRFDVSQRQADRIAAARTVVFAPRPPRAPCCLSFAFIPNALRLRRHCFVMPQDKHKAVMSRAIIITAARIPSRHVHGLTRSSCIRGKRRRYRLQSVFDWGFGGLSHSRPLGCGMDLQPPAR